MTAEHAHGIDGGGEVEALARLWTRVEQVGDVWGQLHPADREHRLVCAAAVLAGTRASAADAVLAEARRLCCGNNPSTHHAASAKHSELMAFAGDLARAVRGLS